jgi:peptidoglycan/LPS O-acetylase OafA/YrhL
MSQGNPSAPTRIPALTGMRFFLAVWVILFHGRDWVHQPQLLGIVERGYLGVDFFFTLSGFILAHVYWKSAVESPLSLVGYLRFVQKRFAKIWPVHLATFLVVFVIFLKGAGNVDRDSFCGIANNLLMLDAWGLYSRACNAWNHPSWSISAEWFAYLFLFPLGAWMLRSVGKRWMGVATLLSWLGLLAYCRWGLEVHGIGISRFGFGIVRIVPEFLAGMWAYQLTTRFGDRIGKYGGFAALPLLAAMLAGLLLRWEYVDYLLLPCLMAVILWLGTGNGWVHMALGAKPMVYLGNISYSMYMVQFPCMLVLGILWPRISSLLGLNPDLVSNGGSAFVYMLLLLLLATLAGALSYHVIEEPCRKLISRIGQKRHTPAT